MDHRMGGWVVIAVGMLLVLISLFADQLGLGRQPGFGWIQWLVLIIGAAVIAVGVYLLRRRKMSR
jgi:LPXTG-motif cell wall-anchored protein